MTKLTALLFFFAIFSGCSANKGETGQTAQISELDQKVLTGLGDLTAESPTGWQFISEANKFCFYLPGYYREDSVQGIDSLVRQFSGAEGVIAIDYGGYSAGKALTRTSGSVASRVVSLTETQSSNIEGTFGAKILYSLYLRVDGDLFFDMTLYSLEENSLSFAKQIFGTVRTGAQCP